MKHKAKYTVPKWLFFFGASFIGVAVFRYLVVGGKFQEVEKLLQPILLAAAVFPLLLAWFISYYEYHGIGPQDGIVRRGPHEPMVAITFDDGPNPLYTPKILDILKEMGVKATFFVVGKNVEKYPDIARRIVDEGHEIGNHTYSHRELVPSTRKTVLNQVRKADRIIQNVTGVKTRLFRPPRGIYSNAVRKLLVEEGYKIVLWTVSSADWSGRSPRAIFRRIRWYTRSGGIILFHDSGALIRREGASRGNTVESLPMVIEYLRNKRGFRLVLLSEMLRRLEGAQRTEPEEVLEEV